MSLFREKFSNSQSNVALKKEKKRYTKSENPLNRKLSNEEVREIRMKQRMGISKAEIYSAYPNMHISTLDKILNYMSRLSPECDI